MKKTFILITALTAISVAETHASSWSRTITFAGRSWEVKSGTGGPGPNNWSDSASSVWVDIDIADKCESYLTCAVASRDRWQ
jgi:hypothetical protein